MSEPDWADEEAKKLRFDLDECCYGDNVGGGFLGEEGFPVIAAALRAAELRGRIAGLREGAVICDTDHVSDLSIETLGKGPFSIQDAATKSCADNVSRKLRARADELEKQ